MNALARILPGPYLLVAQTLTSSCGLLLIKSGLTGDTLVSSAALLQLLTSARFLIGSSLYVFSFAAWIGVLASMPLSTAYPLAIGLTMTCSTVGAAVMLGEQLDTAKLAGVVCVFVAVILLTAGSRR
jgi:multidrug transporter EmrE-like cation transporter